jgi:hypothetical protein
MCTTTLLDFDGKHILCGQRTFGMGDRCSMMDKLGCQVCLNLQVVAHPTNAFGNLSV